MFDGLKNVTVGAAAIIALIPGAGLLIGGLELPAPFDQLIGIMAAIVGPLVFFLVYLARPWIARLPRSLLVASIAILGVAGLVLGYVTNDYAGHKVGEYRYMASDEEEVDLYLVPDPEDIRDDLRAILDRDSDNYSNAIKRDQRHVLALLERDAASVRAKLVAGFLLSQALLIIAFLSAAWAVAAQAREETASG